MNQDNLNNIAFYISMGMDGMFNPAGSTETTPSWTLYNSLIDYLSDKREAGTLTKEDRGLNEHIEQLIADQIRTGETGGVIPVYEEIRPPGAPLQVEWKID